jgi:hypothetical protein
LPNWAKIGKGLGAIFNRVVPVKTIEALVSEAISLAAYLFVFHIIHWMINLYVDDPLIRDTVDHVEDTFLIINFVIFALRLCRRFVTEETNALFLAA